MITARQPPRAAVFTLGCRLNQAESALLCDDLARHGYRVVPWGEPAELLVINSCTVTAGAAAKTRKAVHAARRRCPHAVVAVIGCDAVLAPGAWLADGSADLIVGNAGKTRLGELLPPDRLERPPAPKLCTQEGPAPEAAAGPFAEAGAGLFADRTRAHLKIQEGCDFRCSYCIVPRVRGPVRSRRWEDAIREAAELRRRGHLEIVLTGVNIATYSDSGRDLADLVEAILGLDPALRVRLSSTEPGPAVRRVVELMAREPRLCRFLHLPLQHGDDRILAAMNRRCCVAEYEALVTQAAAAVRGLCLGTDVIAGFPGETEDAFAACCEVVRRLPVNHLHVFTFSPRQGTPAADLPGRVPGAVAAERAAELARIGRAKAEAFARSQVGQTLEVILEEPAPGGGWEGWSDNYLRVEVLPSPARGPHRVVPVRVTAHLGGRRVRGVAPAPANGPPHTLE